MDWWVQERIGLQLKKPTKSPKKGTTRKKKVTPPSVDSIKAPEPLVPHVEHSKNGTVTVLRIPAGTPKDVADKARAWQKHMAEQERKHPTIRYDYKKIKGQISLF